jgi:hypothetical protein
MSNVFLLLGDLKWCNAMHFYRPSLKKSWRRYKCCTRCSLTLYTPSAIWRIDDILGSPAHTLFSFRDK